MIGEIYCHSSVFLIRPTPTHNSSLPVNLKISIFWFAHPYHRRRIKSEWMKKGGEPHWPCDIADNERASQRKDSLPLRKHCPERMSDERDRRAVPTPSFRTTACQILRRDLERCKYKLVVIKNRARLIVIASFTKWRDSFTISAFSLTQWLCCSYSVSVVSMVFDGSSY